MSAIIFTPYSVTLLMILMMVGFLMLGYPVAFVMVGIATLFGLLFIGPEVINFYMYDIYGTLSDVLLVAVPLFIFMGVIIQKSGLATRLYDAMYSILGRLPGGLAVTTVITAAIFAAATGVVNASIITIGMIALPAMLKYNYDKGLATGTVAAGGTLAVIIPPSVLLIIYGPVAGISVGQLFMGAVIPGLLLATVYAIYIIIICTIKPEMGPPAPKSAIQYTLKQKLRLIVTSVLPIGLLMVTVLGAIFFGIATPTEAAAVGALASLILAASYKSLTWKNLKSSVYQTARASAMTFLVLFGSGLFSIVFIRLGGNRVVENLLTGIPVPDWGILISIFIIIFLLGMILDEISIIMIAVPIISPIAAALGYDPLWFGIMVLVTMQTGFLTPPFALSLFYLKGISPPEIKTTHIYKGVLPFIGLQILVIIILYFVPSLITWLPSIMY